RIVGDADPFNEHAGAQDVNKTGRQPQGKPVKRIQNLIRDLLDLALRQLPVEMNRNNGLRGLSHGGWAHVLFEHVEFVCHVDEFIDVASNGGHDDAHQILPQLGRDFQNHAVVEQDDSSIGPDQKVSRVRIGVKKAAYEKLIAVELDEVLN